MNLQRSHCAPVATSASVWLGDFLPVVFFCGVLVTACSPSSPTIAEHTTGTGTGAVARPIELAIDLPVEGMTCSACEDTIRMAVERLPGVKVCRCDHVSKTAHVEFDVALVGKTRIVAAIREVGYTVPIVDEGGCSAVEPDAAQPAR